jgi:hypothetical protein
MGDKEHDHNLGLQHGQDGGGGLDRFLGGSDAYYKGYAEGERRYQEHGQSQAHKNAPDLVGGIISGLNPLSWGGSSSTPSKTPSRDADRAAASPSRPASGGSWSPNDLPDASPSGPGDILSGTLKVLGVFIATQIAGIILLHVAGDMQSEAFGSHQGVGDLIGTLVLVLLSIVLFLLGYIICIPTFIIAIALGGLLGADVVSLVLP